MTAPTQKRTPDAMDRRRRRHSRYRADFSVIASYLEANDYRKLEGHCRDLSEAGMGVLLATDMNIGEVVGLNFSLPGSPSPWELRAVARYRRGYHYGFEFLSLTSGHRESIRTYLKTLEPAD